MVTLRVCFSMFFALIGLFAFYGFAHAYEASCIVQACKLDGTEKYGQPFSLQLSVNNGVLITKSGKANMSGRFYFHGKVGSEFHYQVKDSMRQEDLEDVYLGEFGGAEFSFEAVNGYSDSTYGFKGTCTLINTGK